MKNLNLIYVIVFLFLPFLVSCSNDDELMSGHEMLMNFSIVSPFVSNDESIQQVTTRTTDIGSSASVQPGFEEGDTVGIFPDGGFQIPFKLPIIGSPVASVKILAEGWNTKSSSLYAVYSPFNFYNRYYNKIPWDYRGPQKQVGNDTKTHLGKYWFLASDTVSATINSSGTAQFGALLINMGAVIRCHTTVPKACTIVRMILVAQTNAFPTTGYYDLFDVSHTKEDVLHQFSSSPNISTPYLHQPFVASGYTNHLILDFPGGVTLAANDYIRGWFASPEADLKSQTVQLYLWDTDGNCYFTSRALTTTSGNICRNSVKSLVFSQVTQTTTPFVDLNPWEKTENVCPTCTPVAF